MPHKPNKMPNKMPTKKRSRRDLSRLYRAWRRRPLSGLRWQLTFVSSLLLAVVVIIYSIWISQSIEYTSLSNLLPGIQIAAVAIIIVGAIILFFLINFLLRPLRRMTDAAQAITLGDLQQRERLAPLLEGDDEVSKLAASINDMANQLEHASQEQQASEQRFRRLFSDASHQLRTPLTSLRGFTEVLTRGVAKEDPETTQRVLKLMRSEAERMTRLINDLLILARLDDDCIPDTEYIDLVDLAVEGVEQAKLLADDGRKVTLHFATDERLGVQANADRLKQVLHILFDNAIKYGRPAPEGWIKLQLDRQNGHALVQVIDNGKGIHPDDLPHIFDRFYRGEHIPTYDKVKVPPTGTGLGLAIAQTIVRAHEGEITVQSTPDAETVFTVTLPCVSK
jgi:two-component system OmpR family sensor kinase